MFIIKTLRPGDDLIDAYSVRTTVFVNEQKFSAETETDDIDHIAHHAVLYDGETPVATGRVFPGKQAGSYVAGRIAVLAAYRKSGLGSRIMDELENLAKQQGAHEVTLGAQCQAQPFYAKIGYIAYGDIYMDEHCEHKHMRKQL